MIKESQYKILINALKSMKEEYEIYPTKFLSRQIELAEAKIKAIDKALARTTEGGGNYKSYNAKV